MSEHQQFIDQLRAIGHQLDHCQPGENPAKARKLLRLRKALRHAAEAARDRAERFAARERKAGKS